MTMTIDRVTIEVLANAFLAVRANDGQVSSLNLSPRARRELREDVRELDYVDFGVREGEYDLIFGVPLRTVPMTEEELAAVVSYGEGAETLFVRYGST